MQRVHVDYCGPFLGRYWILIDEDAYSKYPEMIITSLQMQQRTLPNKRRGNCLHVKESRKCSLLTTAFIFLQITCKSGCPLSATDQFSLLQDIWVPTAKLRIMWEPLRLIRIVNASTLEELHNCTDTFQLQYRNWFRQLETLQPCFWRLLFWFVSDLSFTSSSAKA